MNNGGKFLRTKMDSQPPPPPVATTQPTPCKIHGKNARRPKTPPPRRPTRPAVKEKDGQDEPVQSTASNPTPTPTSESLEKQSNQNQPVQSSIVAHGPNHGSSSPVAHEPQHVRSSLAAHELALRYIEESKMEREKEMASKKDKRDHPQRNPVIRSHSDKHANRVSFLNDKKTCKCGKGAAGTAKMPNGNPINRPVVTVSLLTDYVPDKPPELPKGHVDDATKDECPRVKAAGLRSHTSKSFAPGDLKASSNDTRSHLDTLRLNKGSLDDDILSRGKPIVPYVKKVKKDSTVQAGTCLLHPEGGNVPQSKSVDELDRYDIFMDLSHLSGDYFCDRAFRSSFLEEVTLKRQTIGFHSDVQTLLKHSHNGEDHIYSLPQPASYSDNTLKAVKLITDKYDTLQRKQLHAASFREGDLAKLRGTLTLHRELSANRSNAESSLPPSRGDNSRANMDSYLPPSRSLPSTPLLPLRNPLPEDKDAEELVCNVTGLSKKDITRIEMFYKSQDTQVIVCTCLADLHIGNASARASFDWMLLNTGVPLLVLNTGDGHRHRELHLFLAERDTGFPLWRDKINYLTNLEIPQGFPGTLTMRLSQSLSKMAKFDFFCQEAARTFHEEFAEITSDPNDELWRVSSDHDGKKSKKKKKRKKRKSFTTHDISKPCNFQHITNIDPCDPKALESLLLEDRKEGTSGQSSLKRVESSTTADDISSNGSNS